MTEFETIYRSYFQDVFSYLRRLTNDSSLAEELTSEAFFKAMHALNQFRGDCDVRVWLCQIAKNTYFSYLKKEAKTEHFDSEELLGTPSQEVSMEELLVRREDARQIREVLHTIPDPYKEVFMWRVFAELSFRQIGQIFGKSENWACVTYHRARAKITERLEGNNYDK